MFKAMKLIFYDGELKKFSCSVFPNNRKFISRKNQKICDIKLKIGK